MALIALGFPAEDLVIETPTAVPPETGTAATTADEENETNGHDF